MTVQDVAREMYAGKECHDFEFDSLWRLRNTDYGAPTIMQRWQRDARIKWLLTFAWLR